jgi:hypothetical protein
MPVVERIKAIQIYPENVILLPEELAESREVRSDFEMENPTWTVQIHYARSRSDSWVNAAQDEADVKKLLLTTLDRDEEIAENIFQLWQEDRKLKTTEGKVRVFAWINANAYSSI